MKKFLAMLLCLTLVLTAMALVSCKKDDGVGDEEEINLAAGSVDLYYETGNEYGDKFEYEIVNGLEIAIIGFSGSHQPHAITVPSIIDEREVTTIAVGAFYQRSNISSVTLPDTVTTIEDMAFAGRSGLRDAVCRYHRAGRRCVLRLHRADRRYPARRRDQDSRSRFLCLHRA